MFNKLTQRFADIAKNLRNEIRLTESNTEEVFKEIRIALLEADVALAVVDQFIDTVKKQALGETVLKSLTPGQALVNVVHRELTAVMGGDYEGKASEINLATRPPAIILMAGLQGAGKTTTVGKLAKYLKEKRKKKVLTVSCDIYRPAAIAQLQTVTEQAGADFFPSTSEQMPIEIARAAVDWANRHYHDILIVDTAGRLGIDEAMMKEITDLHTTLKPIETFFVVDAMLGQDAVNTAKAFSDALPLTGIILTKLDGDARGGAALSVRHMTGKPIKFVGVSEKLDGLDVFYPNRMANRILGMGDILSLVEEAKSKIDAKTAQKLSQKNKKINNFNLNDYRAQMEQMKSMGALSSIMEKLPMQLQSAASQMNIGKTEKQISHTLGMIDSMTPKERVKPELIKASRKLRIAAGSGTSVQELNQMLTQFDQIHSMMKKLKGGNLNKMMRGMRGMIPGL